jgi:hypothetical protein
VGWLGWVGQPTPMWLCIWCFINLWIKNKYECKHINFTTTTTTTSPSLLASLQVSAQALALHYIRCSGACCNTQTQRRQRAHQALHYNRGGGAAAAAAGCAVICLLPTV